MAGGAWNALQDPQVVCHRSSLHGALCDGVDQPRELCNQVVLWQRWPCHAVVIPRMCHGTGAQCHVTTVSRTLYGTGDSHVASSLTVSQCQEVSQRQRSMGRNQTGSMHALQDLKVHPGCEGVVCRGPGSSSGTLPGKDTGTSHSTVPSSNASHLSASTGCCILASYLSAATLSSHRFSQSPLVCSKRRSKFCINGNHEKPV